MDKYIIVSICICTCKMFQMHFCSFGSVDVSRAGVVSVAPSLTVTRQELHNFVEKSYTSLIVIH